MITMGVPQNLGRKTFILLLSRKTTVATSLFIVSILVFAAQEYLAIAVSTFMALGGSVSAAKVSSMAGTISYISLLIFLGAIIAFLLGFIATLLEYRNYTFTTDEFALKVRRGVFSRREISLPYRQIQDVDIIRTVPHRLFGVSRLVVITAGHEDKTDGKDATDTIFDPIDWNLADDIREFLDRRIGVQIVETSAPTVVQEKAEENAAEKQT